LSSPSRGRDDHAHHALKGDFIVTGADVEQMKFKSRPEARDWCMTRHPASPIKEIGADATAERSVKGNATKPGCE
jgi:hypothetical protein